MSDEIIKKEEKKIAETDISKLIYRVKDREKEKELLADVGFKSILSHEQYDLFQKENTFALLVNRIVVQGSSSFLFEFVCRRYNYPKLYKFLLELVKSEGLDDDGGSGEC